MAVAAQIERVDRDQVMLTRDVDVMIDGSDFERVKKQRHATASITATQRDWTCFCSETRKRR
jgi:hypothetical protein